jgi:hypothetical protein
MDSLTAQINQALAQYTSDINETVDEVMKNGANQAKKALVQTSPADSGKYAKSWAVKKEKGRYIVYNKKPGLTHLLENGHDIIRDGKKVGRVQARPHIKPVEEMISETIVKELESKL